MHKVFVYLSLGLLCSLSAWAEPSGIRMHRNSPDFLVEHYDEKLQVTITAYQSPETRFGSMAAAMGITGRCVGLFSINRLDQIELLNSKCSDMKLCPLLDHMMQTRKMMIRDPNGAPVSARRLIRVGYEAKNGQPLSKCENVPIG